ncbi:MAG: leucine-rich repeat domain-containing protein [Bacteriovoracaceae bacterium]|jgi:leucine-rich repeat protein SHOC2|nr:leucine-rich repeat domain-containing protein [Bacteriovoracaceae bacterium]
MKSKLIKLKKNQSTFPSEVFGDTELTHLDIISEQLEVLPPLIKNLTNLKMLSLNTQCLVALPDELSFLSKLEVLKVKNTSLSDISSCNVPKQLKTFIFTNNKMTSIPPWIYTLKKLEHLDFTGNQITALEDEIINLSNLHRLILDRNNIVKVPLNLDKCEKLNHLSLDGNPLSLEIKEMLSSKFGVWFN